MVTYGYYGVSRADAITAHVAHVEANALWKNRPANPKVRGYGQVGHRELRTALLAQDDVGRHQK